MKKFQSIGVLLSAITGMLVVLLVSVFAYSAKQAFDRREAAAHLLKTVDVLSADCAAQELLRREQGAIDTALSEPMPANAATLANIKNLHRQTENAIHATHKAAAAESGGPIPNSAKIKTAMARYEDGYAKALAALSHPLAARPEDLNRRWLDAVNGMVDAINLRTRERSMYIADSSAMNNELMKVVNIVWLARETVGRDRRLVSEAIISGKQLTPQALQQLAERDGNINTPWGVLQNDKRDLPAFPAEMKRPIDIATQAYFQTVRGLRRQILSALAAGRPSPVDIRTWSDKSSRALQAITDISRSSFKITRLGVVSKLERANREFDIALMLMALSISLASFTLLYVILRVIQPLRIITDALRAVGKSDLDHTIPFQDRRDEIGQFARALRLFRDNIFENRKLAEALQDNLVAKESAEAASRVKSQFLANMSHELRTPLNAIIGFSDLLQNQMFGPLQKQYHDYAAIIHESGNHLLNLVSDILDIAKIEAGKFVLDYQDIDLTECVSYCLRLIKKRADDRGIKLVTQLPAQGLTFAADQRAFRQILINLLTNAVKFSRPGDEVEVSARAAGGRLMLTVKDHGIGMSESLLARIGRPFEQAVNDPAHAREGTGLGLSLVRALVRQHGGHLRIESREGVGTTVHCELPLSQPKDNSVRDTAAA
jgi:signal transduction histidine kinase